MGWLTASFEQQHESIMDSIQQPNEQEGNTNEGKSAEHVVKGHSKVTHFTKGGKRGAG
jgi:hypothetical protein